MNSNRIINKKKYQGFNAVKITVGRDGNENCVDQIEFIRQEETSETSQNRNVTSVSKTTRKNTETTSNEKIKTQIKTNKKSVFENKEKHLEMEMIIRNSH